jgi:hypothetical protein
MDEQKWKNKFFRCAINFSLKIDLVFNQDPKEIECEFYTYLNP